MTRTSNLIAIVASAVTLAAASSLVFAQPGGPGSGMGGGFGAGMGPGYGMGPGAGMGPGVGMGGRTADVASRLDAVKAQLKISAEQEASWNAFADQVKQENASMQALREQMWTQMRDARANGTPADFAALRNAMMTARDANQATHRAAFQALVAQLTPEQQAIANQQLGFGPRAGAGGRGGRGGCRAL